MTRFEVEWVEEVPVRDGEPEIESAKYAYQTFDTHDEAVAFGRQVCVGKFWEVATVREQETVTKRQLEAALEDDYCGNYEIDRKAGLIWLDVGEPEEVESEAVAS